MVALNDNPARKPKASSQRKVSAQSADRLSFMPDVYPENIGMPLANPAATQVPDGSTDYIWQGNQVVEERNPFGGSGSADTPIKQYIWGTYPGAAALTGPPAQTGFRPQNTGLGSLNVDECVQLTTLTMLGPQSLPAGAYYLLQDLLYRAVALTDSSGTIVEAYDTDAYGNTLIFTAPDSGGNWWGDSAVQSNYGANEIIYCGYPDYGIVIMVIGTGLYDPETDLYYVRNRTYNPVLGRWVQRDPIGYSGGINLYEYVGGRAVVGMDPSGTQGQGSFQYIWQGPGTPVPPNTVDPCGNCPPGQKSTAYWQANGYKSINACMGDVNLSALIGWGVGTVGQGAGSGGNVGVVASWAIWAILSWLEYTAWITCISQVCH